MDLRASLAKAMILHSTVHTEGYCLKSRQCYGYKDDERPYFEGWGRLQLNQILRFDDSDFELFLYYGQVNDKKSSVTVTVPLDISFLASWEVLDATH